MANEKKGARLFSRHSPNQYAFLHYLNAWNRLCMQATNVYTNNKKEKIKRRALIYTVAERESGRNGTIPFRDFVSNGANEKQVKCERVGTSYEGLVYTSYGIVIGIRGGRSLTIVRKWKDRFVSGIRSAAESESEGSEGFLPTPVLLQSPMILWKLVKRNRKYKRKNQPITELIPSP